MVQPDKMKRLSLLIMAAFTFFGGVKAVAIPLTQKEGVSPEFESGIPAEVFAFLENTISQIDSVYASHGDIHDFLNKKNVKVWTNNYSVTGIKNLPSMELTLNNGKWYEAKWMDESGNEKVFLQFPASYEVIYGLRKDEIEKKIKGEIRGKEKDWIAMEVPQDEGLIEVDRNLYKRKKEMTLEIEAMTDNVYLFSESDGRKKPVFDNGRKEYSAINLLQGVIPEIDNYKIYINQDRYDSKDEFTVDLSQWLNFCKSLPANVYCSLEEEREDGLKMLVLLDVYALGYRHMLSVILPNDFIDNKNAVLKGKLYTYIPAHNVSSMYYDLIYKK